MSVALPFQAISNVPWDLGYVEVLDELRRIVQDIIIVLDHGYGLCFIVHELWHIFQQDICRIFLQVHVECSWVSCRIFLGAIPSTEVINRSRQPRTEVINQSCQQTKVINRGRQLKSWMNIPGNIRGPVSLSIILAHRGRMFVGILAGTDIHFACLTLRWPCAWRAPASRLGQIARNGLGTLLVLDSFRLGSRQFNTDLFYVGSKLLRLPTNSADIERCDKMWGLKPMTHQ
jgi:hypothetical protein